MELPAWASRLQDEAGQFVSRETCARSLQIKVFGKCQVSTQYNEPQHPWVTEFYKSRSENPQYCPHTIFGKPKPKSNQFKALTLTAFTVNSTRKQYGIGATPVVCCSGDYDMTPDDFYYYEKRGYVRRM